jgi:hypothetical protein
MDSDSPYNGRVKKSAGNRDRPVKSDKGIIFSGRKKKEI